MKKGSVRFRLGVIHSSARFALWCLDKGDLNRARKHLQGIVRRTDPNHVDEDEAILRKIRAMEVADQRSWQKFHDVFSCYEPGDTATDIQAKLELAGKPADLKTIRKHLNHPKFKQLVSVCEAEAKGVSDADKRIQLVEIGKKGEVKKVSKATSP